MLPCLVNRWSIQKTKVTENPNNNYVNEVSVRIDMRYSDEKNQIRRKCLSLNGIANESLLPIVCGGQTDAVVSASVTVECVVAVQECAPNCRYTTLTAGIGNGQNSQGVVLSRGYFDQKFNFHLYETLINLN